MPRFSRQEFHARHRARHEAFHRQMRERFCDNGMPLELHGWRRACVWRGRLYLRIWIAMLMALMLAAAMMMVAWRVIGPEEQITQIPLTNTDGSAAGNVSILVNWVNGEHRGQVTMPDGKKYIADWNGIRAAERKPWRFISSLLLILLAVGIVSYPMAKRVTRRLEGFREAVDAFGEGALNTRVPVRGHDEIAHLAFRFNLAAERIEALMQAQKSLLANASHELRSPLARIRMSLGLMDDSRDVAAHAELQRSVGELDDLVEEILLASRLDTPNGQRERHEEVDLTGLAAEECARVDAELDAEHVVLQGSSRLLRRLVRNLLENARRHGDGTSISTCLKQENGLIILRVCDRGPGVPEDQRERIFEPFYRMPGASERSGGVGLGLALVRSIARHHGGEVRCETHEGGGACFRVELPA